MIKALVIAPYEGLIEIMREISEEVDDFELHTELGNLYEGVEVARRSETNGFDLIISRGGTASLVKEVVSIPVIDIQVSGYDILRLLTLVKGFSGKAAIVGFPNISQGAATICNLLDLDINTITIMKDVEVEGRLKSLRAEGYEVVIGDVFTVEAAKQLGMNGVLITSGKEAVMESLDEARRVYQLFSTLHEKVSVYQSIIDADDRLIGVMNMKGEVVCTNQPFNAEFSDAMIENLPEMKEIIQTVYKTGTKQKSMLTLHNQLWNVLATLHKKHVFLYFEKVFTHMKRQSDEGKQYAVEVQTTVPHVLMTGKSKQIQEVMKQVELYSRKDEPIWIIGETGNGKDAVAQSIYLKSKRNNEPFMTIHCELLKERQLTELLNKDLFRYYANGIVYLKRVDRLDFYSQKKLYQYINTSTCEMPRWIVSSNDGIASHRRGVTIDHDLFTLLGRLIIYIPPLRERVQDIEDLIPVFISEFHSKYSKQIVGIRREAMKELIDYEWPRNVDQLKQVIEQLVLHSHSYYLEKEEVSSVITLLKQRMEVNDVASNQIEVSGTLKVIEKQVITKVLEEEEMNQSKAAKRLGINRSTLWRKLKS